MKALSVRQPWASLIADGEKTIEVRSWPTHHRGPLLICSSSKPDADHALQDDQGMAIDLPLGMLLAEVDISDCRPLTPDDLHDACRENWSPGLWAWILTNPRHIDPIPVKGRLGLFDLPLTLHAGQ
jgi:hypothetical protein